VVFRQARQTPCISLLGLITQSLVFLDPDRTLMSAELKTDKSAAKKPGASRLLSRTPGKPKSQPDGFEVIPRWTAFPVRPRAAGLDSEYKHSAPNRDSA